MDLCAVMDEIGDAVDVIEGLHVYRWPAEDITGPAAMITYPESIPFDAAFQRGLDRITGGLLVLVPQVWDRATRDQVLRYTSGSGPESVHAAIAAHDFRSCAYVRPREASISSLRVAAVDYVAALFELDIAGPGTT